MLTMAHYFHIPNVHNWPLAQLLPFMRSPLFFTKCSNNGHAINPYGSIHFPLTPTYRASPNALIRHPHINQPAHSDSTLEYRWATANLINAKAQPICPPPRCHPPILFVHGQNCPWTKSHKRQGTCRFKRLWTCNGVFPSFVIVWNLKMKVLGKFESFQGIFLLALSWYSWEKSYLPVYYTGRYDFSHEWHGVVLKLRYLLDMWASVQLHAMYHQRTYEILSSFFTVLSLFQTWGLVKLQPYN